MLGVIFCVPKKQKTSPANNCPPPCPEQETQAEENVRIPIQTGSALIYQPPSLYHSTPPATSRNRKHSISSRMKKHSMNHHRRKSMFADVAWRLPDHLLRPLFKPVREKEIQPPLITGQGIKGKAKSGEFSASLYTKPGRIECLRQEL
mmetsp:Transcript_27004/g.105010  ORF Transcript_27004/g.105010 Transcript_27004/m.105010 type:complete len:148 (-) Transcript_27004:212-655(-)